MEALAVGFVYFLVANLCKALICSRFNFKYRYYCWYIQATANLIISAIFLAIVAIAEHGISADEAIHRIFIIYLGVSGLCFVILLLYHLFRVLKRKFYHSTKSRMVIFSIIILIIFGTQSILYHIETYEAISDACYDASYSSTLKDRKSQLKKGFAASKKPGLFLPAAIWSNPIKVCNRVQLNLTKMLQDGECTDWMLRDVPCQCGNIKWDPEQPVKKCRSNFQCYNNYDTGQYEIICNSVIRW